MRRELAVLIVLLLVVGLTAAQCGSPPKTTEAPTPTGEPTEEVTEAPTPTGEPTEEATVESPAGGGTKTLVAQRCTKCHGLGQVKKSAKTADEWRQTVERMVAKGAELNAAEQEEVIRYLSETYPR